MEIINLMDLRKINDNIDIIIPQGFEMYSNDLKTVPTIDYGVVKKDSSKERKILFIFDSENDLITSISGSCTCITAKVVSKDGLRQEVEITYNKVVSIGEHSKFISVYSNGRKQLIRVNVRVE